MGLQFPFTQGLARDDEETSTFLIDLRVTKNLLWREAGKLLALGFTAGAATTISSVTTGRATTGAAVGVTTGLFAVMGTTTSGLLRTVGVTIA